MTAQHALRGTGVLRNRTCNCRDRRFVATCLWHRPRLKTYNEAHTQILSIDLLYSLLALFTSSQLQKHESLFHCLKHKLKPMFSQSRLTEARQMGGCHMLRSTTCTPVTTECAASPRWSPWVMEKPKLCQGREELPLTRQELIQRSLHHRACGVWATAAATAWKTKNSPAGASNRGSETWTEKFSSGEGV